MRFERLALRGVGACESDDGAAASEFPHQGRRAVALDGPGQKHVRRALLPQQSTEVGDVGVGPESELAVDDADDGGDDPAPLPDERSQTELVAGPGVNHPCELLVEHESALGHDDASAGGHPGRASF